MLARRRPLIFMIGLCSMCLDTESLVGRRARGLLSAGESAPLARAFALTAAALGAYASTSSGVFCATTWARVIISGFGSAFSKFSSRTQAERHHCDRAPASVVETVSFGEASDPVARASS
jgi:hypothetical protein